MGKSASSSAPIVSPASWIIIALSLVIGLYLYWFYSHFDLVIKEVDKGPIKEAKANPFYAAEKFLEKLNIQASSHKNYTFLNDELDALDTLVIESSRVGMSATRREQITQWVESGGHLILLATEIYDTELATSRDIFLDELGIRLYENYDDGYGWDDDERLSRVTFEGTDELTSINFELDYYLQDADGDASYIGGNDSTDLFAQYDLEEGMVTVLTDISIWKNYDIGHYDHAMFLYQLVGEGETLIFLYNTIQPTMTSVMIDLIPMVIISFLTIIAVMLFSAGWRKGAPRSDDERIQRGILLHIQAAGEFSYRNDQGEQLLNALTKALAAKLRLTIHLFNRLSDEEKIVKLAQLTGLEPSRIAILWAVDEPNHELFMEKVLLFQEVRRLI